ncbi:glycosyl transferase group 1 [Oscillatoriales cyanobacterium USR001]|nr:glycosyl transferase group 1 [Oscillatoriales cyanobacterium USR001]
MKVSLVVSDLSGNGGAIRAFILSQALIELNYEVEIVGFQFGKELYIKSTNNIPIYALPGQKYPKFLVAAQQLLKKIDGDIIYAVKPKPASFGLCLLKKLQNHRPVILDIDDWELSWHGGDDWKYRPSLKQFYRDIFKKNGQLKEPDHPLYIKWMESLISRADAITVNSNFLKQRFGGVYLPNGKDTEMFDPAKYDPEVSRKLYGLEGYRILMFPGAPRPHKGVEDVLMALDDMNEPDLRLVIVGGSPYDDYDDRLVQQWGRWIIKLPKFPIEVMPSVVAAAHIVVVPQRDTLAAVAQFPLKLTDGMAMAKPILSTQVGDIPEILGATGYLVEPSSPKQISQKIQWIFKNQVEVSDRGMKARQRCVEIYSIQAMASILFNIISGLSL